MAILVVAPEQQGRILVERFSERQDVVVYHDPVAARRIFTQAAFEAVIVFFDYDFDPLAVCCALRSMPGVMGKTPLFMLTPSAPPRLRRHICAHFDATAVFASDDAAGLATALNQTLTHSECRLRALFVDDNPDARAIAKMQILRDFDVTEAANAADALAAYEPGRYDVVLTDYQLGRGLNGGAVLRQIRAIDAATPVLVASNAMTMELAIELMDAGANDAFLKQTHLATRSRIDRVLRASAFKEWDDRLSAPAP